MCHSWNQVWGHIRVGFARRTVDRNDAFPLETAAWPRILLVETGQMLVGVHALDGKMEHEFGGISRLSTTWRVQIFLRRFLGARRVRYPLCPSKGKSPRRFFLSVLFQRRHGMLPKPTIKFLPRVSLRVPRRQKYPRKERSIYPTAMFRVES